MRGHSVTTMQDLVQLRAAAARGLSKTEIARELQTSLASVRYWGKRENLDLWATARRHNPTWLDDVRQLGEWGYTRTEAARRIGVTPDTVIYWAGKTGMHFRRGREHIPRPVRAVMAVESLRCLMDRLKA